MPDSAEPREGGGAPSPLSKAEVRALHKELQGLHSARNLDYATRREMYAGQHWGQPGLPMPEAAEKRYTLTANYIRSTVDKSVQLLLGQMPAIQVMPPGVNEEARRLAEGMEAVLYATWNWNKAPKTFRRVAFNQILLTQGVMYYWWDSKTKRVAYKSVAPDNFYPIYDGEDLVEALIVSRRHTRTLRALYPGKNIISDEDGDDVFDEDRWTRQHVDASNVFEASPSSGETGRAEKIGGMTTVLDWFDRYGNHVRVMGDEVYTHRLGYDTGEVPIIVFPHSLNGDERDSRSEIDEIVDLNLYLDDLLSDQANVIRKYARPTVIDQGSGVAPRTVARTIQQEGGVLPIRKDGDLRFLNWEGTPPDFDNQYNRVLALIYDLSGKPPSAYGQMVSNQSGVATNLSLSPTTAATEERTSVFGFGLTELNAATLHLYEKFMKGEEISVRGIRPSKAGSKRAVYYEAQIRGGDMGGWRENRIKWPSALRTDDPVYIQNELAKSAADSENPPKQSLYTTIENLGIEDVEMEIDRIAEQMADPRLHPGRMTAAVDAMSAMAGQATPSGMEGLDPGMAGGGGLLDDEQVNDAAVASASPHRDTLVNNGY